MPPQLALFLCTVFVIYLLRCERKMSHDVSFALWIPTLWMLAIISKGLGVWFGTGGADPEAGSPYDRAMLVALLLMALMVLFKRDYRYYGAIRSNSWAILLISFMFLSIMWSDTQFVSFKRWIRQLIAVVMAFCVLTEENPRRAMKTIFRRTIYITIPFSLMLIKYYPGFGVKYHPWSGGLMWVGVTTQKNSLGRLCVVAAFFLIWTLVRRKKGLEKPEFKYQNHLDVFILLMTFWLMKGPPGSYSATSTAVLGIGLVVFYAFAWLQKRQIKIGKTSLVLFIAVIIAFGTLTPFSGGLPFLDFTSILGRDQTLTGRTTIWADLVPIAMENPALGLGIGGFWNPRTRDIYSAAHNGYLDVILHYGFVGIFFFSRFLLFACRRGHEMLSRDYDWGILMVCYLVMAVVHNIAESSIASLASHLTALVLFLTVISDGVSRDSTPDAFKSGKS